MNVGVVQVATMHIKREGALSFYYLGVGEAELSRCNVAHKQRKRQRRRANFNEAAKFQSNGITGVFSRIDHQ